GVDAGGLSRGRQGPADACRGREGRCRHDLHCAGPPRGACRWPLSDPAGPDRNRQEARSQSAIGRSGAAAAGPVGPSQSRAASLTCGLWRRTCVMASEIEAYLDAFDEVQQLLVQLAAVVDKINSVTDAIADDPRDAAAMIPSDWPTKDELRALLEEGATSKDDLATRWNTGPERIRDAMPNKRPDMVDQDWDEDVD